MSARIPRIFIQTSEGPPDPEAIDMIKRYLPNSWEYRHFTADDRVRYLKKHPLKEFPKIISKYEATIHGAHKADMFRYWFLYINGGVYMDCDAMIYKNIEEVTRKYSFFSVRSTFAPETIFQGVIGSTKHHYILKEALNQIYNTDPDFLQKNYHHVCAQLYKIVMEAQPNPELKLYREVEFDKDVCDVRDDSDEVLFKHYYRTKIIPKDGGNRL